jgi:ABC-type antimicrobial peptide transport system permease subunit
VRHLGLEQEGGLDFYLPIRQMSSGSIELIARTKLPPQTLAASIGAALRAVEPTLPVAQYQTMGDLVDLAVSPRRFLMLLLSGFAGAALLLAAIGIYGVVAYTVAQRRQEIGIRMALGATASRVRMDVLVRTAVLVGIGAAAGTVLSLALSRVAAPLLYGLEPTDPVTFGATIGGLFTMALLAGYIPALRASRVDPMTALRTD